MKHLLIPVALITAMVFSSCDQAPTLQGQSSKDAEHARVAIKHLKKLKSVTDAGVSYTDYSARVLDAKTEVDSELSEISSSNRVKSLLADSMDAYVAARDLWRTVIKKTTKDNIGLVHFPDDERKRYEKYGITFLDGQAMSGGAASAWKYASQQISEAEGLLSK